MKTSEYLLAFMSILLISCHTFQKSESPKEDTQISALIQKRAELEKQGFNYSAKISSDSKRTFNGVQLSYVQNLVDSSGESRGMIFVQLLNDSVFNKLFIFNNNKLEYFLGDNIITNEIDSTHFDMTNSFGFRFTIRCKNYVEVEMVNKSGNGVSDSWTIQYLDKYSKFDNPFKN